MLSEEEECKTNGDVLTENIILTDTNSIKKKDEVEEKDMKNIDLITKITDEEQVAVSPELKRKTEQNKLASSGNGEKHEHAKGQSSPAEINTEIKDNIEAAFEELKSKHIQEIQNRKIQEAQASTRLNIIKQRCETTVNTILHDFERVALELAYVKEQLSRIKEEKDELVFMRRSDDRKISKLEDALENYDRSIKFSAAEMAKMKSDTNDLNKLLGRYKVNNISELDTFIKKLESLNDLNASKVRKLEHKVKICMHKNKYEKLAITALETETTKLRKLKWKAKEELDVKDHELRQKNIKIACLNNHMKYLFQDISGNTEDQLRCLKLSQALKRDQKPLQKNDNVSHPKPKCMRQVNEICHEMPKPPSGTKSGIEKRLIKGFPKPKSKRLELKTKIKAFNKKSNLLKNKRT